MKTPNPDTNNESLCFVTIVFPITDDVQIVTVKQNIAVAVESLPQVKTEIRITEVRDGPGLDKPRNVS